MFRLSQETIAVVTVGLAILGSNVYTATRLDDRIDRERAEARADREAWQAESARLRDEDRADREAWRKERDRIQDEARADREAWQAEMRALREDTGAGREAVSRLDGIAGQMRTARR